MKKIIKKIFKMMGLTVISNKNFNRMMIPKYAQVSFSEEAEDLLTDRVLGFIDKGFYVDIGAFHPWNISNSARFHARGWDGINVEPNPDNFKLFEQERPNAINLNVGAADKEGELTYYMYDYSALNTFDLDLIEYRKTRNMPYFK